MNSKVWVCMFPSEQCKARQSAVVKDKRDKQQKDKRLILTMEDLSKALREGGGGFWMRMSWFGPDVTIHEERSSLEILWDAYSLQQLFVGSSCLNAFTLLSFSLLIRSLSSWLRLNFDGCSFRYLDQSGTIGCKSSNQQGMLFQSLKCGVNVKHQEYFADSPSTGMDPASRDE
ncbi:hypothetical protein CK203_027403 [Vitis vinifera]|uniref:Uncharacterized protein n=1 Tax=Vitis vinifera TaxID=29760 RepID=A0A438J9R3_VITVI|nr:hypothetical protein CK203_027403 [Vitis vinifera]